MAAGTDPAPDPLALARMGPSEGHALIPMNTALSSTGEFTLGSILLALGLLFCLATPFFGTRGGYYDSDDYDGNGTAH